MINAPDRLEELIQQTRVTGIDFIHVNAINQVDLQVHFLVAPGSLDDNMASGPLELSDKKKIRIYNPEGDVPDMPVKNLSWSGNILQLEMYKPGDFTLYKLYIDDERMDPYYNDVTFDFKANCPSDLDCKPAGHECGPEDWVDFPVDYLARDFNSYKQALLEFASAHYPHWPDRLEADAGVMLAELMSAVGDEMSYYQDRVAREAFLESATQRRSLRRHARLVDYTYHDGLGASAWLAITTDSTGLVPAGTNVVAKGDSGLNIHFEIGKGLDEQYPVVINYEVDVRINELIPHIWDEDKACLPIGSTELYVDGEFEGIMNPGKWVLLQTKPVNPAQLARAHMVRLVQISNTNDPVFGIPITHLIWEQEQATPFEIDLTVLTVHCNMLPATAGETRITYFIAGGDVEDFSAVEYDALRQLNNLADPDFAVEREGRKIKNEEGIENTVTYLFTLPGSEEQPVVRLGVNPHNARPDMRLEEWVFDSGSWIKNDLVWDFTPSFVGIDSANPGDRSFSLEDGAWRRVVGYQRSGKEIVHRDYASNNGVTIRFGDGEFGLVPAKRTVFRVYYRLGNGKWDNVAADTLQSIEGISGPNLSVTNPLPANNGMDAETPSELRQLAPDAFKAITYRAVRPEDYAEAAERLEWVQRAGAAFRWTGSWLSAFVTPDPRGTIVLEEDKRTFLLDHLNRFRQAGREVHVLNPVFANIDIEIEICAAADAFPGEVKERVLRVLLGKKGIFPLPGYFSADQFTFGTPLRQSTLEATIQAVPGVRAVEEIRFKRRGWFDWRVFDKFEYDPGVNSIIRVENDPLHPMRGSLKIHIHGGS